MPALFSLLCTGDTRRSEIAAALRRNGLELASSSDDVVTIYVLDDSQGLMIRNNEETLVQVSASLPPDEIVVLAQRALEVTTLRDVVRAFEDTEAAGVIAANVAQEARDALVPILFSADALAGKYTTAGELTALLIGGLNRVMSILLRIAPVQRAGLAAPTCANTVISELAGTMRAIARHAKVVTRLEDPIPLAAIERTDLERIVLNLVASATDAQRILVATSTRTASIDQTDAPAEDWIVVEVDNDGTTMTDEVCEHVLRPTLVPIQVSHAPARGLPSIARVARRAGGHISIDNTRRGTKIEIWLPRAGRDPKPSE